jgi:RNA polymerase primary sigma factor
MRIETKKNISGKISAKMARLNLGSLQQSLLENILAEPIAYMPDPRFRRPSVMEEVLDSEVAVFPGTSLSAAQEEILFLQLNYTRYRMCQIRRRLLRKPSWRQDDLAELLTCYNTQLRCRSKIVTANMGLVLAMARRVNYAGVELTDLISEGSMALLRATEKFDCSRGWKFSTYACRAILKAFSRAAKQSYRYRSFFPAQLDTSLEKDNHVEHRREEVRDDWIDEVRVIMGKNLADLSAIEQSVVQMRFSLNRDSAGPLTLKEVGDKLGLTKERIRQIQNKALIKLRQVAQERMVTT